MDLLAAPVARALGLSVPVCRFLVVFATCVPLSAAHRLFPRGHGAAAWKHAYSAAVGIGLSGLAFGAGSLPLLLLPVAAAYGTMQLLPRFCGTATFGISFAFLIACHVLFMSGDTWKNGGLDCTGALMILTLKATSIAMDCQDGVRRRKRKKAVQQGPLLAAPTPPAAPALDAGRHKLGGEAPPAQTASPELTENSQDASRGLADSMAPGRKPFSELQQQQEARLASGLGSAGKGPHTEPRALHGAPLAKQGFPGGALGPGSVAPAQSAAVATGEGEASSTRADGARSSEDQDHALDTVPSLLEALGYCFCCGLHLAGPFFFFRDYQDWTLGQGIWAEDRKQPPYAGWLFRALAQAICAAVGYLYLQSFLDLSVISTPASYFALPLWRRALLLYHAGTWTRFKFYFIWSVSEAAMVASGLGFSGWTGRGKKGGGDVASWERARNCHVLGVEFATSAATFAINWNTSVGKWLRTYVYERLVPEGKKPRFEHLLITQLVSAVWHGMYPGYMLFFTGVALEVAASRVLYRWEKLIPPSWSAVRALATFFHGVFAAFCNNFFAIGFIVLSARETITAWAGLWFAAVILCMGIMAVDMVLPKGRPKKPKTS